MGGVFVALIEFDLLLGAVSSLKEKRSVVRPIVAEIRRKWPVAVAETEHLDLYRRAGIGVAVVSNEADHCRAVGEEIESCIAARPDVDLLSARWRWVGPSD